MSLTYLQYDNNSLMSPVAPYLSRLDRQSISIFSQNLWGRPVRNLSTFKDDYCRVFELIDITFNKQYHFTKHFSICMDLERETVSSTLASARCNEYQSLQFKTCGDPLGLVFFQPHCKYCGQPQIVSFWMKHNEISAFTCGSIMHSCKKRYLKNKGIFLLNCIQISF